MSWSKKYKKSIDCSNPKGFSQKAHCAGRDARQGGKKTKSKSVNERIMKLNKEEANFLRETHNKWLKEGRLLAKLFAKIASSNIKNDKNIMNAIKKADDNLEKSRNSIETSLGNDKSKVKDAIPKDVRRALGFDY